MGKLKYFTYLHCSAIWDDFLQSKQDSSEGKQWGRGVVIIYPDV